MHISRKELASLAASTLHTTAHRPARANINQLTDRLRLQLRAEIARDMQPWMVLLDESVRFFVYLERYQYSRKLARETSPFALQLSRLRSDVLSIRELVSLGQEAPAHTLARSFVDGIELAMALAEDPLFAVAYSEAEDESDFWKKQIGYGRIYGTVESFVRRGGSSPEEARQHIARHKAVKDLLSGHVHIASYSAFRSGFVPSISRPGMLRIGAVGALSAHLPQLCLLIAEESHTFAACCINAFIKPNPPVVFASYKPTAKLHDATASAHILQNLLIRYSSELERLSETFFADKLPLTE